MTIVQAVLLGLVEGITEFLPISSTAHLILTSRLLSIAQTDFVKLFEVVIQASAVCAVIVGYIDIIKKERRLLFFVLLSFVPTGIVGLLLHKIIKDVFFESTNLITASILVVGILFIVLEYVISKKLITLTKSLPQLTVADALFIGLFQACAVIPGVSRAGAVIVFMLIRGYKRSDAALYSFLLAVPTIIMASVYDILKTPSVNIFATSNIILFIVGCSAAFFSALFVVKWFVKFLQSNTLIPFGIYRIILAIIIIIASVV